MSSWSPKQKENILTLNLRTRQLHQGCQFTELIVPRFLAVVLPQTLLRQRHHSYETLTDYRAITFLSSSTTSASILICQLYLPLEITIYLVPCITSQEPVLCVKASLLPSQTFPMDTPYPCLVGIVSGGGISLFWEPLASEVAAAVLPPSLWWPCSSWGSLSRKYSPLSRK